MEFAWSPMAAMRRGRLFTKIISVLIIQTFVFSNVAFGLTKETSPTAKPQEIITNPEKIVIPREFGLVKTRFTGNDGRLIVHIQDAHCNYEAQANIVKILEGLVKNYSLTLISVEGADGAIDTSWFKAFPDDEIRKEVAAYFMKKGEITGPEFLSITSDYSLKLFGAETRSYYIQNLNAFTASYPLKEETERYYTQVKNVLNRLKGYIYSEELKVMDSKLQEYESKKIQFNDYVRFLQDMAERQKITLRDYDNFFKLVNTLIYEKKIDFNVTDKERSNLIDELSKKVSKETLTDLVTQSIMFKTGKIASVDYYHYLRDLSTKSGIDMNKDYPNLYNYIIYNSVYSKIENEKLFADIRKVETAVKEKLFRNDDQRILDKLSHHADILLGLINIKLLNGDFDYYEKNKGEFTYEVFNDFIKKKTIQYGFAYEVEPPSEAVANSIPKLEDFYSIAIKRDKALVDNTLEAMKSQKQQISVLITGGFHSEGMVKLLEKAGVSYMVVCPTITKDTPTPYIQILTNQRTPLEEILLNAPADTSKTGGMMAPYLISAAKQIGTKGGRMLERLAAQVSPVEGRSLADRVKDFDTDWTKTYIYWWIYRAERFAGRKSLPRDREILKQAFKLAVDSAVARKHILAEYRDAIYALADRAFEEIYKSRETAFAQQAQEALLPEKPAEQDMVAKRPAAKKVPGMPGLTAADLVHVREQISKSPQGDVVITQAVKELIKTRGPPSEAIGLLSALTSGRLKVKWADIGIEEYLFERKSLSMPGAGAFYDEITQTIYFPRAFVLEANNFLMAQALVHEYVEEFGKEPEFGTRHSMAVAAEKLLSSPEAAKEGVSDYTKFFVDKAATQRDYRYFWYLIANYDTRKDAGSDFLQLIYRSLERITDANGLLPKHVTLTTREDILAWYRYNFENSKHEYKGVRPYDKARLVSQKIDDMVAAGNISVELRDECFFRRAYDNEGRVMVWIPQSFIRGPPEWFTSIEYNPLQNDEITALKQEIDALRQKIAARIASLATKPEAIAAQEAQADFEATVVWRRAWQAVENAYAMMTREESLQTVDEARRLWKEALESPEAVVARETLEKVIGNKERGMQPLPEVKEIQELSRELGNLNVRYYAAAHRPFLEFVYNQIDEKKKEKEARGDYSPVVVAISGSGGAGKTTLEGPLADWAVNTFEGSTELTETIEIDGVKFRRLKIGVIATDSIGLHSARARYVEVAGGERLTFVKGHEMYSPDTINDTLLAFLQGVMVTAVEDDGTGRFVKGDRMGYDKKRDGRIVKIVLMEGITPAHFTEARDKIDITITIAEKDDSARFDRKIERDTLAKCLGGPRGLPRQHVINDFCDKQHVERHDMVAVDLREVSDIVWAYNEDLSQPSSIEVRTKSFYPRRMYGLPASPLINGFMVAFSDGIEQMISQGVSVDRTAVPQALKAMIRLYNGYRGTVCEEMMRNFIKKTIADSARRYPIFARGWLAAMISHLDENERLLLLPIIDDIKKEARDKKKVVTIIPVGGRGARFAPFGWHILKPFYRLFGKSHFMHAVERAMATGRAPQDIFFFIEKDMIEPAKAELRAAGISIPEENFLPEIEGRDENGKKRALEKAAMFGMAAHHIAKLRGADTIIVFERSDLILHGPDNSQIMFELTSAIDDATTIAALEPTIGILGNPPTQASREAIISGQVNPPSGKGYIFPFAQREVNPMVEGIMSVNRFHEKPELQKGVDGVEQARQYVAGGATYNASYFVFKVDTLLQAFEAIRPDECEKLVEYGKALGASGEEMMRSAVTDYFVRKGHRIAFEQGIVEPIAPVAGTPQRSLGLAMASLGPACSSNWVGAQGTLAAVWLTEKIGNNYFRPQDSNARADIGPDVEGCNILLGNDDAGTVVHVKGVKGLAIAYEEGKKALVVAPIKETRKVDALTATVKKDIDNSPEVKGLPDHPAFTEPGQPVPQVSMKVVDGGKGNNAVLGPNGSCVMLESNNTVVYSEEGIVAVTNLDNAFVISTVENGVRNIYVYGSEAWHEAIAHLARLSPYPELELNNRKYLETRIEEVVRETERRHAEVREAYAAKTAQAEAAYSGDQLKQHKKKLGAQMAKEIDAINNELLMPLLQPSITNFQTCYNERSGYLREAVDTILKMASSENPILAVFASQILLKQLIQPYKDMHSAEGTRIWLLLSAQMMQHYRNEANFAAAEDKAKARELDSRLRGFSLNSEEDIIKRYREVVEKKTPFNPAERSKIKAVFVMSRGKIGGEIACNSIIMAKAREVFPEAKIVLVGGKKQEADAFFQGTEVIGTQWESTKTPFDRYNYYHQTLDAISSYRSANGIGEENYIVLDSASPFLQLGLLPVMAGGEAGRYFLYDMVPPEGVTIGQEVSGWVNEILGRTEGGEGPYTAIQLKQEHVDRATEVWRKLKLEDRSVICLSFGTDNDSTKWVNPNSVDFEASLVARLAEMKDVNGKNYVILLSKGAPKEQARAEEIMARARELNPGLETVDIDTGSMEQIAESAAAPRLIGFKGSYGDLGGLLAKTKLLVCYSSSPKHLAGAFRVPVVDIYVRGVAFDVWEPFTKSPVITVGITPQQAASPELCVERIIQSVNLISQTVALENALRSTLQLAEGVIANTLTMQEAVRQAASHITPAMEAHIPAFVEMASQRSAVYGVNDQTLAQALRIMQIVYLSRSPLGNDLENNLVYYPWAGRANNVLVNRPADKPIAEVWMNSTEPTGDRKLLTTIPNTAISVGAVKIAPLTLKELIASTPQVIGGHKSKPTFVKFLCTRFSDRVHMGSSPEIAEMSVRQFTALAQDYWRHIMSLRDALIAANITEEKFKNEFMPEYERWAGRQADNKWTLTGEVPTMSHILPNLRFDWEGMRRNIEMIVSVLNEIKLVEGKVILSPVTFAHAIFGLSHQTHPPSDHPAAKNEAWIVISAGKDENGQEMLILVEPQQMSNITYSFVDIYTPLQFKEGKLSLRKGPKELAKGLDALVPAGEQVPQINNDQDIIEKAIPLIISRGLRLVPTGPEDFDRTDEIRDVTDTYAGHDNSRVESLIEGTYMNRENTMPVWPVEYFIAHRITMSTNPANPSSITITPEENNYHELVVTKGTVTVQVPGRAPVTVSQGSPLLLPATITQPYTITAQGPAEILKFVSPLPEKAKRIEGMPTVAGTAIPAQEGVASAVVPPAAAGTPGITAQGTSIEQQLTPEIPSLPSAAVETPDLASKEADLSIAKPGEQDMARRKRGPAREGLTSGELKAMIAEEQARAARELAICSAAAEDKDAILILAVDTDIYAGKARNAISGLAGDISGKTKPGSIVVIAGKGAELADNVDEAERKAARHGLRVRKVVTQLSAVNATAELEDRLSTGNNYVLKITVTEDLSRHYMQVIRLFQLSFQIGYYNVETGQGLDSIKRTLSLIMGRQVADSELAAWLANKIIDILPRLERIDTETTAVEAYKAVKKALTSL